MNRVAGADIRLRRQPAAASGIDLDCAPDAKLPEAEEADLPDAVRPTP